jgi:hypothetical protein
MDRASTAGVVVTTTETMSDVFERERTRLPDELGVESAGPGYKCQSECTPLGWASGAGDPSPS